MGGHLISVIIPIYNVKEYIDRCMKTVVSQSYAELEIILVDDGSTDGSGEKCDEWAARDSRVRVIHTSNAGAAAARNVGLDIARGDYIMFVDADDYLEYAVCQILYDELQSKEAECSICGFVMVDENGKLSKKTVVEDEMVMKGIEAIRCRYLQQNSAIHIIEPWGKLFCRTLWNDRRFTNGLYYEDLDIMPYVYCDCNCVAFVPKIGYYYYQRSDSASHAGGTDDKRYTDSVLIRQKHIHFYNEIGENDLAVVMARRLIDLIITSACNGWIPESAQKESCTIFDDCVRMIKKNRKLTLKEAFRYSSFKLLGAKGYCKLILRK